MSTEFATSRSDGETLALPRLRKPYLLLVADVDDALTAKTAFGLRDWIPADVVGQWRFSTGAIDLGLPDLDPAAAYAAGARSLVIGAAPSGGAIPEHWAEALCRAAAAGLDIVSGLHQRLASVAPLAAAAERAGVALHDVRRPPANLPIGSGDKRPGKRLLTVGADCAIGKKYTALAIARDMAQRGFDVDFRASGQTGLLIAGSGLPLDAVVADFLSGAAEALSPGADPRHWDVIEGQGSLFHPSYAGVALGLLHGSQPDALVLCYDPWRREIDGCPGFPIPSVQLAIDRNLEAARLTNPAVRFVGVSINGSGRPRAVVEAARRAIEDAHGLPCIDPMRDGAAAIIDRLGEA